MNPRLQQRIRELSPGVAVAAATLALLLIAGIITAILMAPLVQEKQELFEWMVANPEQPFPREAHQDLSAREDAASAPQTYAMFVAAPLWLYALVDLHRQWSRRGHPAWFTRPRSPAMAVGGVLLIVAVNLVSYGDGHHLGDAIFDILWPILMLVVAWTSVFAGHWIGARTLDDRVAGRRRRLACGWLLAFSIYWPLLSIAVLGPDWTSNDLLATTGPATVLTVALTLAVLASAAGRTPIFDDPVAELEAPAKPTQT